MPALSPKLVTQSKYHPLVISLEPLRAPKASRVPVLAGFGRTPLLTAELSAPAGRGPRKITIVDINDADVVVASIDSSLEIRNQDGAIFGKLENLENQFWLKEPCRMLPRLAFVVGDDATMTVTWHRSKQRLFSKLLRNADGELVATCTQIMIEKECYLEVRGCDGCDNLLVLLCALALLWQGFLGGEGAGSNTTEAWIPGVGAPSMAAVSNDCRDAA